MKKLIFAVFLIILSAPTFAGVKVIVHSSNDSSFDKGTIEKIFLGKKKSFSNGSKTLLLTLPESSSTTTDFNSVVLNRDSAQLKAYWSKLVFTGKGTPPEEITSEIEMVKIVSENPNTIGFVSSGTATDGVKVVGEF